MTGESLVRAALEARLVLLAPAVDIAYENKTYVPVTGQPYQRVNLMRAQPENPTFDSFMRLLGIFQVTLMYDKSSGPGAAELRAELVKNHYPRRLSLPKGGITVTIDKTPYIMSGFQDGDRWAVPVRVPYFANI